jgi:hypothetical protein
MRTVLALFGITVFILASVVAVDPGQGDEEGLGLLSSALAGRRRPPPPVPFRPPPPPPPDCRGPVQNTRNWADGEIRKRDNHINELNQTISARTNELGQCNAISTQRLNRFNQCEADLKRANEMVTALQQGAEAAKAAAAKAAAEEEEAKKRFYESIPVMAEMMTKAYDAVKAQRAAALKVGTDLWNAAKLVDEAGPEMQKKLMAAAKAWWNNLKEAFNFLTAVRRLQDASLTYDPDDAGDVTRIASLRARGITPVLLKGILANEGGGTLAQYGAVLQGVGAKQLSAAFEAAKEALVASARVAEGYFNAAVRLLESRYRKMLSEKGAEKFAGMITKAKDQGLDAIVKLIVEIEEGLRGKAASEEPDDAAKKEGGESGDEAKQEATEPKKEAPPPEEEK